MLQIISTGGVTLTRDKKAPTEPETTETPTLSSEQCPPQVQNIYFQAGDAATGGRGEKGDTGPPGEMGPQGLRGASNFIPFSIFFASKVLQELLVKMALMELMETLVCKVLEVHYFITAIAVLLTTNSHRSPRPHSWRGYLYTLGKNHLLWCRNTTALQRKSCWELVRS